MLKVGKVKLYDNWNGIITSNEKDYVFRKDDITRGEVKVGDEVNFVSEVYPQYPERPQILTARFVEKKGPSR